MVAENETEINDQVENGKISVDQLWTNILSNNAKNQLTLANKRAIILGESTIHIKWVASPRSLSILPHAEFGQIDLVVSQLWSKQLSYDIVR